MTQTRILTSEVCNRRKVVSMEVVVVMQELLAKLWFWEKVDAFNDSEEDDEDAIALF